MDTRDILSTSNDDLLRATNDKEVALLIQPTKVARGNPAFGIDGSRSFAPVAAHCRGCPCKDLPDAICIRLLDPHFDDRQWSPNAARSLRYFRTSAGGDDAAHFCQAIQRPSATTNAGEGDAHLFSEFTRNISTSHRHRGETGCVIAMEVFVIDDTRYHGWNAPPHPHFLLFD